SAWLPKRKVTPTLATFENLMPTRRSLTKLARTPFSRVLVTGVSLLCAAAIYFGDTTLKATNLAPLVTIPVLAVTYVLGVPAGLAFGVVAGIAFGTVEHGLQSFLSDAVILTATFAMVVALFGIARRLHARSSVMELEIGSAKTLHDTFFVNVNLGPSSWRPYIIHVPLREMGGDFYALDMTNDRKGEELFVADVSGKGIQASMLHSALKTLLRADNSVDPGEKLSFLNQHLMSVCANGIFCTAWYGLLQGDGSVYFSNAGHERPFVQRVDGTVEQLRDGQIILGFGANVQYVSSTVRLLPGEKLLVYTDGLTEILERGDLKIEQVFDDFEEARRRIVGGRRRDDVLAIRLDYKPVDTQPAGNGQQQGGSQILA
ncbi:MAG: PP2C family protein-serine/threonine phosphatase, partial [Vulcanimicrobiaceae bacterium]